MTHRLNVKEGSRMNRLAIAATIAAGIGLSALGHSHSVAHPQSGILRVTHIEGPWASAHSDPAAGILVIFNQAGSELTVRLADAVGLIGPRIVLDPVPCEDPVICGDTGDTTSYPLLAGDYEVRLTLASGASTSERVTVKAGYWAEVDVSDY